MAANIPITVPSALGAGYVLISDASGKYLSQLLSGLAVLTDQSTPQHIINGAPIFDSGLEVGITGNLGTSGTANAYIDSSGIVTTPQVNFGTGGSYIKDLADLIVQTTSGYGLYVYSPYSIFSGDISDPYGNWSITSTGSGTFGDWISASTIHDQAHQTAYDINNSLIYEYNNLLSIDLHNRHLIANDGTTVVADFSNTGATPPTSGVLNVSTIRMANYLQDNNGNTIIDNSGGIYVYTVGSPNGGYVAFPNGADISNYYNAGTLTIDSSRNFHANQYLYFDDGSSIDGAGGNLFLNSFFGTVIYNGAYIYNSNLFMSDGGGNHQIADSTGGLWAVTGVNTSYIYGYGSGVQWIGEYGTGGAVTLHNTLDDGSSGSSSFHGTMDLNYQALDNVGYMNASNGTQTVYLVDGTYAINVTAGNSYFAGYNLFSGITSVNGATDGNGRNGLQIYDFVNGTSAYIHADVTYAGVTTPNNAILFTPDGQNYYGSSVSTLDISGNFYTAGTITGFSSASTQVNGLGASAILSNDDGSGNPYLTLGYGTMRSDTSGSIVFTAGGIVTNSYSTFNGAGQDYSIVANDSSGYGAIWANGKISNPAMPTSDPADGQGTLWYDTGTNIVYRGT